MILNSISRELGAEDKYYKKVPIDIEDKELSLMVQLKIYEKLEQIDNKQSTIKNIMIFWFVITIIIMIIGAILAR